MQSSRETAGEGSHQVKKANAKIKGAGQMRLEGAVQDQSKKSVGALPRINCVGMRELSVRSVACKQMQKWKQRAQSGSDMGPAVL